jgi:hypothetical protein
MKAFPQTFKQTQEDGRVAMVTHYGMNLRDYFAAQCIPLVARYSASMGWTDEERTYYAKVCYVMADAMMKAREE